MELQTDRLLLRPFNASDLGDVQRYAVRPEFYRYLPIPEQTPDTVAAFLKACLQDQRGQARNPFTFAIELKELKQPIGSIRLEVRDVANWNGDLGFALDSEFQHRGYMTEAVRRVLAMGFDKLDLHRIWATTDVENAPSWRLMERIGMIREGRLAKISWCAVGGATRSCTPYSSPTGGDDGS